MNRRRGVWDCMHRQRLTNYLDARLDPKSPKQPQTSDTQRVDDISRTLQEQSDIDLEVGAATSAVELVASAVAGPATMGAAC